MTGRPPSPGAAGLVLAEPRASRRPPVHLADLDVEVRRERVAALGLPAFRADQLSRHYFGRHLRGTPDPADAAALMTDLPALRRDELVAALLPDLITPVRQLECDGGTTVKTVWRLFDGALVESVVMRYPDRATLCLSSQAGCGMNCPFCATGQAGLTRSLSTAEIVEQAVAAAALLGSGGVGDGPARLSNVVFMGMGEPLANYRAVVGALRRLVDEVPAGLGLSQRNITVSTVGLVPAIDRLADEGLAVTLAVSLHAPDDALRDELVPINTRFPISEVLEAAWRYADRTGRRVSVEYALIRDVNDQQWRAEALAALLRGHLVHVNLIPLNPTPGSRWTASRRRDERAFADVLRERGIPVSVRDTRGREIDGACGQLAALTP